MKDIAALIVIALIIISVLAFNAFLIYHGVAGWGWFLFVSVIILGGLNIKVD